MSKRLADNENTNAFLFDGENRQFRLLADSISQLAWVADKSGWIHWYNKRWFDYTGTTPEQMAEWGWSAIHHPEHQARVFAFVTDAWTKGEPWELTFPLRRADGEFRWFLTRAFPVKDDTGNIEHWIGTSTDVHSQTQTEKALRESELRYRQLADELESEVLKRTLELNKSNVHLKELNEQLERFNYASSHDLQEPIRKIALFAGKIKTDDFHSLSADSRIYFDKILQAADRMSLMLKELLQYSSTTQSAGYRMVDINQTLRHITEDLELQIQQTGAIIHCDPMPPVRGVPVQIHQLFYNIVSNALKFIRPGVPPVIHISAKRLQRDLVLANNLNPEQEWEHFCIRDNGVGFDQEEADVIFELFRRLNARHEFPGTGIGLALCKKIVDHHGGKMKAVSGSGEGATFYVALPAATGPSLAV